MNCQKPKFLTCAIANVRLADLTVRLDNVRKVAALVWHLSPLFCLSWKVWTTADPRVAPLLVRQYLRQTAHFSIINPATPKLLMSVTTHREHVMST